MRFINLSCSVKILKLLHLINSDNICRIWWCPIPPLSCLPCEFGRILVFNFFSTKILCKKLCLWTDCELDFFSFKYGTLIIKQLSSCSFDIKVANFLKIFGKIGKIKNHLSLVPSRIWENLGRLGGLDNVEYGNCNCNYYLIFILIQLS